MPRDQYAQRSLGLVGTMVRWLPYAVLTAVVCGITKLPVTNDAAWQFWIGRQLAGGAELYRDIIEVNPPIWFWLAVPIVQIAALLGTSAWTVLVVFLGLSAGLSIALVQRLYPSRWIGIAMVFAFFLTGLSATGQREQFTLVAVAPYVFLAATRANRNAVPTWLAVSIGVFAALGISLKHYFALVSLALEVWLSFKRRWSIRPELIALCVVGAAYVTAVVLLTPNYLLEIVPMIREAYGAYDRTPRTMLTGTVMSVSAVAVLGLALLCRRSSTVQALGVAGMAFLLAFLLQRKGFRYQGLPAIGLFSIMAVVAIAEQIYSELRSKAAGLILAVAPLLALATTLNHWSRPYQPAQVLLCNLPHGSKVLVLTSHGNVAWPAVEQCGLLWTSRYMFLWMLPAVTRESRPTLSKAVHEAIVDDMARHPPNLILIESHNTDTLQFVMSDPAFRAQLMRYNHEPSSELVVFRK